jgi:hypothetical protein
MFSIYVYKSTLGSRKAGKARKAAALSTVDGCLDEQGKMIEIYFKCQDWVVVL